MTDSTPGESAAQPAADSANSPRGSTAVPASSAAPARKRDPIGPRGTLLVCAALLLLFAFLANFAASSKSPTYDEPLHAAAAWMQTYGHDYRVDPEGSVLWKYWAAIPNAGDAIKFPTNNRQFAAIAEDPYTEWKWTVEALYPCGRVLPPNSADCPDADAFVQRGRRMMSLIGMMLGALIAYWAWRLGGARAAITAAALFALDPNFLAHAALVKNDVPITLCAVGLFFAVWRAGQRVTPWNTLAIGLLCAAAVTTKFSGLLFGPMVVLMLLVRAVMREPWVAFSRRFDRFGGKLLVVLLICVAAGILSYVGIWAAYGFRFNPSRDPSVHLDLKRIARYTALTERAVELGHMPTTQELAQWRPNFLTRSLVQINEAHLLPQAWLSGLLYTYQSALYRPSYLMGRISVSGWWYYFPLAMLFKTPVATLAAFAAAAGVLIAAGRRLGWRAMATWSAACLAIPPAIFMASVMRSNLNLGVRHVLPVYPFLYIGVGLAVAYAWRTWGRAATRAAFVLALILATETLSAFPNYLAFFNLPSGGSRGGIRLLGDSNLDWGQDLKLLAQWQQAHRSVPLYLSYFGLADPWSYGIGYYNFPGGYGFGPPFQIRADPGVLAISATNLQGIYQPDPQIQRLLAQLRATEPLEVLGGTIYLYQWPLEGGGTLVPTTRADRDASGARSVDSLTAPALR